MTVTTHIYTPDCLPSPCFKGIVPVLRICLDNELYFARGAFHLKLPKRRRVVHATLLLFRVEASSLSDVPLKCHIIRRSPANMEMVSVS